MDVADIPARVMIVVCHGKDRQVARGSDVATRCGGGATQRHSLSTCQPNGRTVCVYYCSTYYKAVRVGEGGEWRTCATRDDKPRPVWTSLPITH